jgi:hypothetical protein
LPAGFILFRTGRIFATVLIQPLKNQMYETEQMAEHGKGIFGFCRIELTCGLDRPGLKSLSRIVKRQKLILLKQMD